MPGGRPKGLGRVPGSGRKAGQPNRKTQAAALALVQACNVENIKLTDAVLSRLEPVDVMIHLMRAALRAGNASMALDAARSVAPFVHAKLANVNVETRVQRSMLDYNDNDLDLIAKGQMQVPDTVLDAIEATEKK